MFISVVIPAYNEEKYLPACLRALQQQTYPADRYEIIVVDNASTDRTAQIARSFGAKVVYEPAKGFAQARQAGFAAATGQVIASTDADTIVPPFWLERIAGHFERRPQLGGVCGPVHWFDGKRHEQLIMKYPVTWAIAISHLVGRPWWIGSNFAVSAKAFWLSGGFHGYDPNKLLGEDLYISLRISQVAPVLFDPDLVVRSSSRRALEGYRNYLYRMAVSTVRVTLLGQPPLPTPDIR